MSDHRTLATSSRLSRPAIILVTFGVTVLCLGSLVSLFALVRRCYRHRRRLNLNRSFQFPRSTAAGQPSTRRVHFTPAALAKPAKPRAYPRPSPETPNLVVMIRSHLVQTCDDGPLVDSDDSDSPRPDQVDSGSRTDEISNSPIDPPSGPVLLPPVQIASPLLASPVVEGSSADEGALQQRNKALASQSQQAGSPRWSNQLHQAVKRMSEAIETLSNRVSATSTAHNTSTQSADTSIVKQEEWRINTDDSKDGVLPRFSLLAGKVKLRTAVIGLGLSEGVPLPSAPSQMTLSPSPQIRGELERFPNPPSASPGSQYHFSRPDDHSDSAVDARTKLLRALQRHQIEARMGEERKSRSPSASAHSSPRLIKLPEGAIGQKTEPPLCAEPRRELLQSAKLPSGSQCNGEHGVACASFIEQEASTSSSSPSHDGIATPSAIGGGGPRVKMRPLSLMAALNLTTELPLISEESGAILNSSTKAFDSDPVVLAGMPSSDTLATAITQPETLCARKKRRSLFLYCPSVTSPAAATTAAAAATTTPATPAVGSDPSTTDPPAPLSSPRPVLTPSTPSSSLSMSPTFSCFPAVPTSPLSTTPRPPAIRRGGFVYRTSPPLNQPSA